MSKRIRIQVKRKGAGVVKRAAVVLLGLFVVGAGTVLEYIYRLQTRTENE